MSPKPDDRPQSLEQLARIEQAVWDLQEALLDVHERRIHAAVARLRQALGPYAGVPEDPESYARPIVTDPVLGIDRDFKETFTSALKDGGCRSALAQKNRMELRGSAYIAMGCLAAAEAGLPNAEAYLQRAAEELDYLVSRQQPEGFFGYPADPGGRAPQNLRERARRIAAERPEYVRDGFIVREPSIGAFQFDTGCCGCALAYGYERLGDKRYLQAARKAGDWALAQPLAANWNYNSFSVWLLAKLYAVTGERTYLDGALEKAKLGVLPGQMENGRWLDQHNAKWAYHWIMVRALTELLTVLPRESPDHAFVRQRTLKAVECRVEETLGHGAQSTESSVVALTGALEHFGPNAKWERALNVLMNALHTSRSKSPYAMGVYLRRDAKAERTP